MSEKPHPSVKSFFDAVKQGKLVATKCKGCGHINLPPKQVCENCGSTDWDWVELKGRGTLETYTVIHIAPAKFAKIAPYVVGVAKLEEGPKITGIVKAKPEEVKIGMNLVVDYGELEGEKTFFFKASA